MESEKTIKVFETIWPQLDKNRLRCVMAYAEGMISMIPEKNDSKENEKQKEVV